MAFSAAMERKWLRCMIFMMFSCENALESDALSCPCCSANKQARDVTCDCDLECDVVMPVLHENSLVKQAAGALAVHPSHSSVGSISLGTDQTFHILIFE